MGQKSRSNGRAANRGNGVIRKKRRNIRHTCRGKTRFRDEKEATRALHIIRSNDPRQKSPVRVYRCPECKGVHLTSVWFNHFPEPE